MRHIHYAAAALLGAIAACTASGAEDPATVVEAAGDAGGTTSNDGGVIEDGGRETDAEGAPDAERPLICGDAGYCETKLPTSDVGLPLSLQSVREVASNDVWSVTAEGFVLHYDGTSWTTELRVHHALSVVWATGTSVWVGGELGLLFNRNAAGEWRRVETGYTSGFRAITGTSDADVWFVREDGLLDHYDGTAVSPHPIDIPDLRITTVFSRPGLGTYAAGYVQGPSEVLTVGKPPNRFPYVLALSADGASIFNTALPGTTAVKGFVPVAADVTDAPDEKQRIFLFGYLYTYNSYTKHFDLDARYMTLGTASTIKLNTLQVPNGRLRRTATESDRPPRHEVWARDWNHVFVPVSEPYVYIHLIRWDGASMTAGSLAMGHDFVPRGIFGIHGNGTDSWLVGDGFALKGSTP